jgi:hypothetical protein
VRLSTLGTATTTGLLYQPQMIDDGDCGANDGIKIGRGNRSTRRIPASAPLCPPQIPHDQTRARTRACSRFVTIFWTAFSCFLKPFVSQEEQVLRVCHRPFCSDGLTFLLYWQENGPIRHVETCPDFFFHCKSTHNKIHCQNFSC